MPLLVPPGVTTVICAVPLPGGGTAVICVAEATVNDEAGVEP
ncbi:hypothetical protein ACFT8W_11765 [Streptomyces hygroscopicus]